MTEVIDAKSSVNIYEVPGGYLDVRKDEDEDETIFLYDRIMLKEMTGHEEDILSNVQIPITDRLHTILGRCIVEMTCSETGEKITDPKVLLRAPSKMLMSDTVVLLVRLRQVSLGDQLAFRIRCPDKECKTMQSKSFNLASLELVPMKGDRKQRLREYTTDRDNVLHWEMVDGAKESSFKGDKTKKRKSKKDRATDALMMRVVTLNNEPVTVEKLKDLSMKERNALRDQFDDEGGMDTSFEVVCSGCGLDFQSDMEVTGKDFFSPSETSED